MPVADALAAVPPCEVPGDRLPETVLAAIQAAGLWKLWVPRRHAGLEASLPEALQLFEAAGCVDGSLGFALAIGTGGGLFAAWLPHASAEQIFRPDNALIAGSGAPSGTARIAGDDCLVDGHWRYASLIHSATWVTANTQPDNGEEMLAVAVPVASVAIENTWDVHALAGTDSQDFRMHGVRVPRSHTFRLSARPRIDTTLYRFDFMALAAAAFASVAVGIARGALAAIDGQAAGGATAGGTLAARVTRATGTQRAAWQLLDTCVRSAWATLDSQNALSDAQVRQVHLAAVQATRLSVEAVDMLAAVAGMRLLERRDRFSQCWRDVHAVAQHTLVSVVREAELGG
ncbi:MAG: hypothetical protein JJU27_08445 [Gammaproteobacteria bacterium]|nr:hypothetical protein [Gammaproteobacteria bacterium]